MYLKKIRVMIEQINAMTILGAGLNDKETDDAIAIPH